MATTFIVFCACLISACQGFQTVTEWGEKGPNAFPVFDESFRAIPQQNQIRRINIRYPFAVSNFILKFQLIVCAFCKSTRIRCYIILNENGILMLFVKLLQVLCYCNFSNIFYFPANRMHFFKSLCVFFSAR